MTIRRNSFRDSSDGVNRKFLILEKRAIFFVGRTFQCKCCLLTLRPAPAEKPKSSNGFENVQFHFIVCFIFKRLFYYSLEEWKFKMVCERIWRAVIIRVMATVRTPFDPQAWLSRCKMQWIRCHNAHWKNKIVNQAFTESCANWIRIDAINLEELERESNIASGLRAVRFSQCRSFFFETKKRIVFEMAIWQFICWTTFGWSAVCALCCAVVINR